MRIAIDIRALLDGRYSGIATYTTQLIRAMQSEAPEHEYLLFYNSARPVALPFLGRRVQVRAFRYPNKIFNALQFAVGQPTWDRLIRADCFFLPSFRLAPLATSVPLVTTIHDVSYEYFPEFFSTRRRLWHRLMRPRRLLERSEQLLAVSQATSEDVQEVYGIAPEKITVIHSGLSIYPLERRTSVAQVRARYALPQRYILYCGTLEPRKNIPGIIRAFSASANRFPHHLVVAGARGWLTRDIDAAIRDSQHRQRIHQIGAIPEADKASLYAAADLFVYPSFYEGFGFPPLEALALGTPVVTSYNSSLPEVVGEWATLVDPYNPGELAVVLQEIMPTIRRVAPAVQSAVQQRYTWQKTARETLAVIERVVKKT